MNINNLGLHTFRQKISIIPQDPVMFVGTLRHNLDPFDEKTDDEIWHVLEQVNISYMLIIIMQKEESFGILLRSSVKIISSKMINFSFPLLFHDTFLLKYLCCSGGT